MKTALAVCFTESDPNFSHHPPTHPSKAGNALATLPVLRVSMSRGTVLSGDFAAYSKKNQIREIKT